MKPIVGSLGVLALLLVVSSFAVSYTAAPNPEVAGEPGVDAAAWLAASDAPACSVPDPTALPELAAVTPHCCSSAEISACSDLCKQQGPGCKGSIGCRAGECVCTCNCPGQ